MSVFDGLAALIPQVSASCRQTKENPKVCLSPPTSLSSPVIKKKAIQIPSFNEKGLVLERQNTKLSAADRSFDSVCASNTSSRPSWSKSCQPSQRNHGERASTLPRSKPKTYGFQSLPANSGSFSFPAPKPNASPTLPPLKPKPSDCLHLPASQLSDPSPVLRYPEPKPSVSPTLTVPTPRLSPSPTSLCQGTSSDGEGGKRPSPVAKERRARSIPISNANIEPSIEAKHEILDQEALLDFTRPELKRFRPLTSRDLRHQTYSESCRSPAASHNHYGSQRKLGMSRNENITKEKTKNPPGNIDIAEIPKPNIKQQQEFKQRGVTGAQTCVSECGGIKSAHIVHREVFDELAAQSSLNPQRKYSDYPQRSNYIQTLNLISSQSPYEQMCSEKRAASPVTPNMSFSTERPLRQSAVSPNIEMRRRQFDSHSETRAEKTFLSHPRRPQEENDMQTFVGNSSQIFQQTCASQHIKCPQRYRLSSKVQSQTSQMDGKSALNQADCASRDYSCQLRYIDQKTEAAQYAHRLHRVKTCQVAPQTQEASRLAPVECTTSHRGPLSNPDLQSHKHRSDQEQSPGQNKSHREVNVSNTGLDISAPPDHCGVPTKLLEHPSEKCVASWPPSVAHCPFNTNRSVISSMGVFDLLSQPQRRLYQGPRGMTTTTTTTTAAACLPPNRLNYPVADRAFVTEESEDPYYVTMYYPGSVYVGEYNDKQTTWKTLQNKVRKLIKE